MKCQNPHPTEESEICSNEATRKLEINIPGVPGAGSCLFVCSSCAIMFKERSVPIEGTSN